jgi:hypothetical protein
MTFSSKVIGAMKCNTDKRATPFTRVALNILSKTFDKPLHPASDIKINNRSYLLEALIMRQHFYLF